MIVLEFEDTPDVRRALLSLSLLAREDEAPALEADPDNPGNDEYSDQTLSEAFVQIADVIDRAVLPVFPETL